MKKQRKRYPKKKKHPLFQVIIPSRSLVQVAPSGGQSEIARIRAQIQAEQESAQRALYSPAYGTSQHLFITRRMERIGVLHEELEKHLTPEEAAKAMIKAIEKPKEGKGP